MTINHANQDNSISPYSVSLNEGRNTNDYLDENRMMNDLVYNMMVDKKKPFVNESNIALVDLFSFEESFNFCDFSQYTREGVKNILLRHNISSLDLQSGTRWAVLFPSQNKPLGSRCIDKMHSSMPWRDLYTLTFPQRFVLNVQNTGSFLYIFLIILKHMS
jgi:hypothetical protein